MKSKALYFLMAAAIALTFVTVETISTRIGHAVVPIKLEAVNRLGKTDRLFDRVASITVVRGAKTALLTAVRQVPGPVVFVAANRDGKADRLAQRRITQAVVRTGKTGALVRTAALKPQAPSERANRLEKASRLAKASADQFVARGIKTDSLKLIFAALTSVEGPEKTLAPAAPEPMVIDGGVAAQGGPLVFVPVTVSLNRQTNVAAEPLDSGAPAKTL